MTVYLTVAAKPMEGPPRPLSQFDQPRMSSSDGGSYGMQSRPLNQQMEAVSTPVLPGNVMAAYVCIRLSLISVHFF